MSAQMGNVKNAEYCSLSEGISPPKNPESLESQNLLFENNIYMFIFI